MSIGGKTVKTLDMSIERPKKDINRSDIETSQHKYSNKSQQLHAQVHSKKIWVSLISTSKAPKGLGWIFWYIFFILDRKQKRWLLKI
jgi:hypothetical protein